jgi:hypothetical protein
MAGKRNLTLDLKPNAPEMSGGGRGSEGGGTASGIAPSKKARLNGKPDLLTSPDVQMLKLTSPQLAEFLTRNPTLATPTPSGGYQFPMTVTKEQELYVRGFEEALKQKHQQGTSIPTGLNTPANILAIEKAIAGHKQQQQQQQQLQQQQLSTVPVTISQATLPATIAIGIPTIAISSAASVVSEASSTNSRPSSSASGSYNDESASDYLPTVVVKQEPGINNGASKPPTSSSSRTGKGGKSNKKQSSNVRGGFGISPINMETQEAIKLERKRLRNRLAASKCRKRKLERISNLDEKVADLKSENGELLAIVKRLKDSVCNLKQEVMEHVQHGCQVNIVTETR